MGFLTLRRPWMRWTLLVMITVGGLAFGGAAQAQHTSPYCSPRTATVASGGVVEVDLTSCDNTQIGLGNGVAVTRNGPSHGTATTSERFVPPSSTASILTYSHNGDAATQDIFDIQDNDGFWIQVTITISAPTSYIVVTPASLPSLNAGTALNQALSATGGTAPYSFSVSGGTLIPGLNLSSSGILSGTPSRRGNYTFSVTAQDSLGATAVKSYSGTIGNPSLSLATGTVTLVQGAAASAQLATNGGVAPYIYATEPPGTPMPFGLSLSTGGLITGTPASSGSASVQLRVTDSSSGPGQYFELETLTINVVSAPSVSIAVSPASVSEDGATNLTYTVTRSANLSSPTTVNITTGGTAAAGVDYTGNVASVTIPAGSTTASITINPTTDSIIEPDETVTLSVAAGTGYTVGAPSSATGTILNDDVPTATIAVSPATVAEDGAPNLVYTVTLSQAPSSSVSINYTVGGTATNGTDYAAIASPLVIAAGSTSGTVTVNPTADATIEADETAILSLAAGTGYVVGAPNSATGTILNDDLPSLSINDVTAAEGNSGTNNFTFTVSLSAPAGPGGVSFDIATANGTAAAGSDYVARSLTGQTIPAGASSASFTVTVNGDTLNEASETFFANVTNVVNAVVIDGQGVGTITNDDPLPAISTSDVSIVEGNSGSSNAIVTVTLDTASGQTVTVNYATANGSATQPSDYGAVSGTLTFTPGQTSRTIAIPVVGDTVPETNEAFSLGLFSAVNATIAIPTAFIAITNDDVPVTLSPGALTGGQVAAPYSQTVSATGGTGPYGFSVTAGALPSGLTLALGGLLSGTPTAGGTFNFTVTATDSSAAPGPFSGSTPYSLSIAPPTIVLPATPLAAGQVGTAYSATITAASGGTAPYGYAVTGGSLPGGVTLDPATGSLSGTPTAAGSFSFRITATDSSTGSGPYSAFNDYAIDIAVAPPVANAVSATIGYGSGSTGVTLSLSGGAATSVAIVTPPSHGTATASGTTISYQPVAGYAGPDSFTYSAANASGTSAPATVSLTIADPAIGVAATGPLAATVGTAYSQTFTFSGGAQPFGSYQVNNLPAGVAITGSDASSVTIAGTPTQSGSFSLTVSAIDSSTGNGPFTASQPFVLTVDAPTLSLAPGAGTLTAPYGAAFSQAFAASGGVGPFSYSVIGTLPAGLAFGGNMLTGTPSAPGVYPITVTATDSGSTGPGAPFAVSVNYSLSVPAPTIVLGPAALAGATVAASYSQTLTASGGVGGYAYAVTTGALPTGLTLSGGGGLSGTPTVGGSFGFTITATDANGQAGAQAYTLVVAAPALTLPATSLPQGQVGAAYSATILAATGGTAPYSYAVTGGALPAGVTLSPTGQLRGTPGAFGSFSFTVTATDSSGGTGPYSTSQAYTLTIVEQTPVTGAVSATVAYGSVDTAIALAISGGTPASVAITNAPSHGTANVSGTAIRYTPAAGYAGPDSFAYTASNAGGTSAPATATIQVSAPTISIAADGSLAAIVGTHFDRRFLFSGGAQPFSAYQVTGLPAGLTVSTSDAGSVGISGTPTQAGSFVLTVSGTDASTGTGPFIRLQAFTLTVAGPTLALAPPSASFAAAYAAPFSQQISATGGVGPYSYAVSGNLPAGVAIDPATGVIAGTPTAVGNFAFSVTARDDGATGPGAPFTAQGSYSLTVAAPTILVTPAALPPATAGASYSALLSATGGVGPYSYALASGTLPAGIALAGDGTFSGTPTVSGDFAIGVTATDANGQTSVAALTLTVANAALTITPASLPNAVQGIAYSQQLTAAGGVAPYSFAVSAGSLPAGITISPAGLISGTPTGSGNASFTILVTDSTGGTASTVSVSYVLAVTARPNPANDPEVRGLVQAQVASARRFADVQVGNFSRRLEGLRHGGGGGFRNGLRISASDPCLDTLTAWTNSLCASSDPAGGGRAIPGRTGQPPLGAGAGFGAGTGTAADADDGQNASASSGPIDAPLAIWAGGAIRYGDRDPSTGRPSERFESEGITLGADYRFGPDFAIGIGVGIGRDTTDVGRNGSQSRGEAKTIALYGSHLLGGGFFVDWLGGYQWLDFDLRRYVTATSALVNSSRKGRQWFGAISAGADIETGDLRVTPYVRIDAQRGRLDGYVESSGSLFDLRFLDQDVAFTSLGLGARLDYRIAVENGYFLPRVRVEYQRDVERQGDALVAYFDQTGGPFNAVPLAGYARSRLLLGLGLEMAIGERTSFDVEYNNRQATGAGSDQGVTVNLKQAF
ncbi:hemagglutinin-like protein [Sphingopyxis sp. MC1]|nr:hemagglutinin-like protein [Sphingopyxis sp. MC1]